MDVECFVLDDPGKTAVISQRGMGQAMGFSKRGDRLSSFVNSKTMEKYIGRDLRQKLENPLVFQHRNAAAESAASTSHGFARRDISDQLRKLVRISRALGCLCHAANMAA